MKPYYHPLAALTGAVHQQPQPEHLLSGSAYAFLADFSVEVDLRYAIDATTAIPCGSVRGLDFADLRIACAHCYRDGWLA